MNERIIKCNEGEVRIHLEYDEDPSPPDEMGDCEPEFFNAVRGNDLRRKLEEEFGDRVNMAANTMVSGDMYQAPDKSWYWGLTEYRHGGSAFALCGGGKNWPDQQWDVIPLSGWIKISQQLRKDWGIHGKPGVKEKARANAVGCLKEWEAYFNGHVFGYVVEAFENEDKVLDESCWGYYQEDDAETDATSAAEYLIERLGWTKQP